MSASAIALTGFAAWTLLLVLGIGVLRLTLVLSGNRAPNQFDPGGADVSDFSRRLCRAHANCYENLPIFGALVAVGLITGKQQLIEPLAIFVLYLRVAQSVVHVASGSNLAVNLRFLLYLGQWVLMAVMAARLLLA